MAATDQEYYTVLFARDINRMVVVIWIDSGAFLRLGVVLVVERESPWLLKIRIVEVIFSGGRDTEGLVALM